MAYDFYVESRISKHPVTYAPNRKKELCTFSVSKSPKKRISQMEERKLGPHYIKRQVTWLARYSFVLQKRYSSASVIVDASPQWIPDCAILEGMFMVQTPAIPTMSNM